MQSTEIVRDIQFYFHCSDTAVKLKKKKTEQGHPNWYENVKINGCLSPISVWNCDFDSADSNLYNTAAQLAEQMHLSHYIVMT